MSKLHKAPPRARATLTAEPDLHWTTVGYSLWARLSHGPELGVPLDRERAARLVGRYGLGTDSGFRDRVGEQRRHTKHVALEPRAYKELDPPYDEAVEVTVRVERMGSPEDLPEKLRP